jgi:hypothetical protein
MNPVFKTCLAAAVAAAVVAGACSLSWAYILPGDYILWKVSEARVQQGFQELTAEGQAEFLTPAGPATGEARLHYSAGGCLETTVTAGSSDHAISVCDGNTSSTPAMKPLKDAVAGHEAAVLAALPGRTTQAAITDAVRRSGTDIGVRSLGRFHGRVAFVVGAGAKDRKSPQIWIDKDSFNVLRLIAGSPASLEVKLTEYHTSPLPGRFPRNIEILSGGRTVFRMVIEKVYAGTAQEPDEDAPQAPASPAGKTAPKPQQPAKTRPSSGR